MPLKDREAALADLRARRDHYNETEGDDLEAVLDALDTFLDWPPPPSPAVDAAPIDREAAFRKKAQERAARAHNPKPVKPDTRPRCTAITRRGHACLSPAIFGDLCTSHAASRWHRYVKQQAASELPTPQAPPEHQSQSPAVSETRELTEEKK